MAATRKVRRARFKPGRKTRAQSAALQALSLAALALPGLTTDLAHAQDSDSLQVQETHYSESTRTLYGNLGLDAFSSYPFVFESIKLPQSLKPIEADSLRATSQFNVDRFTIFGNYSTDTWSGATPIATARAVGASTNHAASPFQSSTITGASPIVGGAGMSGLTLPARFDRSLKNSYTSFFGDDFGPPILDNKLTEIMSSASPETREQFDGKVRYEWDNAALDVGGGYSEERDYISRFANVGGSFDFNEKQTTLSWGASYTTGDTHATLDPDALMYLDILHYVPGSSSSTVPHANSGYVDATFDPVYGHATSATMHGDRQDVGAQIGLTQVLNKDAVATFDVGYTRSTGYLSNPYKAVVDYTVEFYPGEELGNEITPTGSMGGALLEVRPDERNLFSAHLGLAQYINPFDAALHLDYSYAHDDWGIDAHTFSAEWAQPVAGGWVVTPSVRYYSQSAASFYTTGIFRTIENGVVGLDFPQYFSSDTRLSGFGSLSAGVSVSKELFDGISFETSFEYFTHKGSLKLGGVGEQAFGDYNSWMLGAALKVTPSAVDFGGGDHGDGMAGMAGMDHAQHAGHENHQGHHAGIPAGISLDHALAKAGDYMIGFTHESGWQGGNMLSGTEVVDLATVRADGCGGKVCAATPDQMGMRMDMLHLMYAPTDWLTLAVMPELVNMNMDMTHNPDVIDTTGHDHAGTGVHETGGFGDTGLYALFKMIDAPNSQLTLALGGTAPTGRADIKERKTKTNPFSEQYYDYGMQTGSGTWDFAPSLTYVGGADGFSWGAQATGTIRGGKNDAGYALGNEFQASVWGGYRWTDWLTTTVRGIYTAQGAISGAFPDSIYIDPNTGQPFYQKHDFGPGDQPGSYGGQFWDLGLGVNFTIPQGAFAGNTLKFEWLQPLRDDVNGYQLARQGKFAVSWSSKY